MTGWIKVFRKLQDWQWYSDSQMVHLFIHLLLEANHEKRMWKGIEILPGQLIFGRKVVAETLGMSERQIRTRLTWLKTTNELTIKTTNRFSLVTIVNWEKYQMDDIKTTSKTTSQRSNKRPANDQQTTTPKEYKEDTTNVVSYIHPLCLWIKKELPTVSKMKNQLTNEQAENLVKKFDKKIIREVLESMDNYVPLLKKSKDVNKTIQNWISRRDMPSENKNVTKKDDFKEMEDFYRVLQEPILKVSK